MDNQNYPNQMNNMPPITPIQPAGPAAPGMINPVPTNTLPPLPPEEHQHSGGIGQILVISFVSIIALIFVGLFVWKFIEYNDLSAEFDAKLDTRVTAARKEITEERDAYWTEQQKYPYLTFTGPEDYGSLSFEYPRTWSVYVNKDASKGGDYEAYLHPVEVSPVSDDLSLFALRVYIKAKSMDDYIKTYDSNIRNGKLTMSSTAIHGTPANVYHGEISRNIQKGYATVFKLRDKTVVLETDAEVFKNEYEKLLKTVTFSS